MKEKLCESFQGLAGMVASGAPKVLLGVALLLLSVPVAKGNERVLRIFLARRRLDNLVQHAGLDKTLQRIGIRQKLDFVIPRLTYYLLLCLLAKTLGAASDSAVNRGGLQSPPEEQERQRQELFLRDYWRVVGNLLFYVRIDKMISRKTPLFVLPLLACLAWADQVTLKNGDRVTGKIVKKDGAALTFKSDVFGVISIPWETITMVTSDEPLTVVLPDGKSVQGKLATADNKLVVTTPTAEESVALAETPVIRNADEQKAWERLQHPGWLQLWGGYVDFGASLARGNADTTTMTTGMNASRATRTDKTIIYFNQIYSTAAIDGESNTTAQAVRGGWAYNRNLNPRLFWNFFNDYEYDKFQNLNLRLVLGTGLGYSVLKTERTRFDLLGGGAYTHEDFSTPLSRNSGSIYWGNDWNYRLTGNTAFNQSFRMFNNLTETGEFRINFDVGTVTALTKWLSFQVTYSDRYLSNPVGDRKNNDVLFTTGLRINFAR